MLLYRVISFWLILPTGWGALAWLAWTGRRRTMPAVAGDVGSPGSSGAATGGAAVAMGPADGEGTPGAAGR